MPNRLCFQKVAFNRLKDEEHEPRPQEGQGQGQGVQGPETRPQGRSQSHQD